MRAVGLLPLDGSFLEKCKCIPDLLFMCGARYEVPVRAIGAFFRSFLNEPPAGKSRTSHR